MNMTTASGPTVIAPPGLILSPGDYFLELAFTRPVSDETLTNSLARMGFEKVIIDQSVKQEPAARAEEWGVPGLTETLRPVLYRVMGRLRSAIRVFDTPAVQWLYIHQVPFDAFDDEIKLTGAVGRKLESKQVYAFRVLAWMRKAATRANICEALAFMGFSPIKVMALKRNLRLPDKQSASTTRWYAIGRWDKASSFVTVVDPLWFEDVQEISL